MEGCKMFNWKKLFNHCFHNWKYNGNERYRICKKCKKTQLDDYLITMEYIDVELTEQEIKEIFKKV